MNLLSHQNQSATSQRNEDGKYIAWHYIFFVLLIFAETSTRPKFQLCWFYFLYLWVFLDPGWASSASHLCTPRNPAAMSTIQSPRHICPLASAIGQLNLEIEENQVAKIDISFPVYCAGLFCSCTHRYTQQMLPVQWPSFTTFPLISAKTPTHKGSCS